MSKGDFIKDFEQGNSNRRPSPANDGFPIHTRLV